MTRRNVTYDIALNGEEAVEKWRTGTFHLILVSSNLIQLKYINLLLINRWIWHYLS